MKCTLGRVVHFVSRTGKYECAAIAAATQKDLYPPSVDAGVIPALSSDEHLHLCVFSAGPPGKRAAASDFLVESPHGRSENAGGIYQEWDVPHDEIWKGPGTWHWPEREG